MTKLDELVSFILSDKLKEIRNFDCYDELVEEAQKLQREQVKNITYEPLLGTGLCENCSVPKMTNSGNGVDEPTNPVLYCHKESLIIEPVPYGEQTDECAWFEPCA